MFWSRNKIIVGAVVVFLLIGLVLIVSSTLRPTNTGSNALSQDNLNTASQISSTTNSDGTMGPATSLQNYSESLPKDKTGTLTFSITDPFPTALPSVSNLNSIKSFLIRVKKIEVLSSSGHWETLTMPLPVTVDLASINNSGVANLGETVLSAENYLEIRIYIDKASMTTSNDLTTDLSINNNSGVVRIAKDFSIVAGSNTNIIVDFNASKSYTGNVLTPFVANFLVSH